MPRSKATPSSLTWLSRTSRPVASPGRFPPGRMRTPSSTPLAWELRAPASTPGRCGSSWPVRGLRRASEGDLTEPSSRARGRHPCFGRPLYTVRRAALGRRGADSPQRTGELAVTCILHLPLLGLVALTATLPSAQDKRAPAANPPAKPAAGAQAPAANPPAKPAAGAQGQGEMKLPPGVTAEDMAAMKAAGTPGAM